jgi:hypothetical protein
MSSDLDRGDAQLLVMAGQSRRRTASLPLAYARPSIILKKRLAKLA